MAGVEGWAKNILKVFMWMAWRGLKIFNKLRNTLTNDKELSDRDSNLISILFLLISVMLTFVTYEHEGFLFNSKTQITPDIISGVMSIALLSPMYLRNIFIWKRSLYHILSAFLIFSIFASFFKLAMISQSFFESFHTFILLLAIILTWIGLRAIAGFAWILVLLIALYSIVENNINMGYFGFLYIIFGFLGILLHSKLNPGEFFKEFKSDFSGHATVIKNNANAAINETKTKTKGY